MVLYSIVVSVKLLYSTDPDSSVTSLIKYFLNIPFMVIIICKKCSEPNSLTPHAYWNITDFGAKCERCETINMITLKNGEFKKTRIAVAMFALT
jgi:hypothetical protein